MTHRTRTETEKKIARRWPGGADLALRARMSDDSKLPSTRQMLAHDAAAARSRGEAANSTAETSNDEDFRRVMTALRVVLQMSGS
jgi:hypothetical protein